MNKEPETRRKYRSIVLQKLAKYFDVDKTKAIAATDMDNEILQANLRGVSFHECIYVTHVDTLKLEHLLYHHRFIKSPIYTEFIKGKDLSHYPYVMALHINGVVFMIHEADSYEGVGGILINNPNKNNGFVIEPIENFLANRYPKSDPE